MMTLDGNDVVDATVKGGVARFVNHSCIPNCAAQKWSVGGETHVGLFATADIPLGEEITFDYQVRTVMRERDMMRTALSLSLIE